MGIALFFFRSGQEQRWFGGWFGSFLSFLYSPCGAGVAKQLPEVFLIWRNVHNKKKQNQNWFKIVIESPLITHNDEICLSLLIIMSNLLD